LRTTGDVKISPRNCWLTNLSIAVLVKKDICQNYLYYHLKDLNLRYLDSGAAQSQITINSLEHIYIIKPNENVQHSFNDYINLLFKQIENLQTQNQRLKDARDILLPRLMTGMIDVSGKIYSIDNEKTIKLAT
jgi:type I restriction enzyme S subunit